MPTIGKQALQHFGTESQGKGNGKEGKVENPTSSRIENPIEGDDQEEEGEEMEDFVIDPRDLGGTEAYICSTKEKEDKCAWFGVSGG